MIIAERIRSNFQIALDTLRANKLRSALTILGVVIGSAVMRVLYNAINILGIPNTWEFVIIGAVLLGGVITDEFVRRWMARRRRTAAVPDWKLACRSGAREGISPWLSHRLNSV